MELYVPIQQKTCLAILSVQTKTKCYFWQKNTNKMQDNKRKYLQNDNKNTDINIKMKLTE